MPAYDVLLKTNYEGLDLREIRIILSPQSATGGIPAERAPCDFAAR